MKLLLILFLVAFASHFCFGQNKQSIDSLKALLKTNVADTLKVKILFDLSDMPIPVEEQNKYVQEGINLADKVSFQEGKLQIMRDLAFKNNILGNWAKGLAYAYKGLDEALKFKNKNYELGFMNMVALSFQKQRDYKTALFWSSAVLEKLKNGYPKVGANEWAANMQSCDFKTQINQPDSAIIYGNKSIEVATRQKLPVSLLGYSYGYLGRAYVKLKKYDLALQNYEKALGYLKNDPFSLHEVQRDIAEMYMRVNDTKKAEKYALEAYKGASKITNPNVMIDASAVLFKIYESQSLLKAYPYLKTYQMSKDSIFSKEKYNQIYQLQLNEKRKADEKEQELIAVKNHERQNWLITFLSFLAVLATSFAFLTFQKQKANKLLQEQKERVEKTLSELKSTQVQLIQKEKMASLGELTAGIAHEIQNPLNFVNNFSEVSNELIDEMNIELDKGDIKEAKAIAADVKQNLQKVNHHGKRASSIVKGMLEHSRSSTGQKELTDINELTDEYLRLSYHGLRAKDSSFIANFKLDLDPDLPKINVIPQEIGRVLLNLINNAFYAVGQSSRLSKEVIVSTKTLENQVLISVKDNGNGIPKANLEKIFQPFFTTKPTGEGTGLGLSLSYDITTKGHGGTLDVVSVEGEGSEFIIHLPIKID